MSGKELKPEELNEVNGGIEFRSEVVLNYKYNLGDEKTIPYGTGTVVAKITARGYYSSHVGKNFWNEECYNLTTSSWNYGWWYENGDSLSILPDNTPITLVDEL